MRGRNNGEGSRSSRRRFGRPGFTMLEATMALALMLIGIMGMGAFAVATVRQNTDAQDMTEAASLAQRIGAHLKGEAVGWNAPAWNIPLDFSLPGENQPIIGQQVAGSPATGIGWQNAGSLLQPTPGGGAAIKGFTREHELVVPSDPRMKYCAHVNLTWLQYNETMRADIRVFWTRRGTPNPSGFRVDCSAGAANAMISDTENVRSYSLPVLLSRNVGG